MGTSRISTDRSQIIKVMTNWINEADHSTIIRVFNSEFVGSLSYDIGKELYTIDRHEAKNLNIIDRDE